MLGDAIVTFPATIGRIAAYSRPGLATIPGPHAGSALLALSPTEAWTSLLAGQRVLVIHPQAELMVKRWSNVTLRRLLWTESRYLPHALPNFTSLVGYVPVDAIGARRPVEPDCECSLLKEIFDCLFARGLVVVQSYSLQMIRPNVASSFTIFLQFWTYYRASSL